MRFTKRNNSWVPKYLRNQRGFIPGIMPIIGPGASNPLPITGIIGWWRTPIVGLNDTDDIPDSGGSPHWPDISGNAVDLYRGTDNGTHPTYSTATTINSLPTVKFVAANFNKVRSADNSTDSIMNGLTEASIYLVGKWNHDPTTDGQGGIMKLNGSDQQSHIPYIDGTLYSAIFTDTRKATGVDPTPSFTSPFYIGWLSKSASYKIRMNGSEIYSTGTNTFATLTGTNPLHHYNFGNNDDGNGLGIDGYLAEIIIVDHFLSAQDITDLESYISTRYSI